MYKESCEMTAYCAYLQQKWHRELQNSLKKEQKIFHKKFLVRKTFQAVSRNSALV